MLIHKADSFFVIGLLMLSARIVSSDLEESSEYLTLEVENFKNVQYFAKVHIGSLDKVMTLALGLGTSWTWIPLHNRTCEDPSNIYDNTLSSTYTSLGFSATVEYYKGSVQGQASTELFSLGTIKDTTQAFLLCPEFFDLDQMKSEGVLGLGFNSLSEEYLTLVENLKQQGIIEKSLFAIYLSNAPEIKSFLFLGGYDTSLAANSERFTLNVNNTLGSWMVNSKYFGFGNTAYNYQAKIYLDSSTSIVYGKKSIINSIKRKLKNKFECITDGYLMCVCNEANILEYPNFYINIDDYLLEITPKNYLYNNSGECRVLFENSGSEDWILGQPFLREYYSIFNMDQLEIILFKNSESGDIIVSSSSYANGLFGILIAGISLYIFQMINSRKVGTAGKTPENLEISYLIFSK